MTQLQDNEDKDDDAEYGEESDAGDDDNSEVSEEDDAEDEDLGDQRIPSPKDWALSSFCSGSGTVLLDGLPAAPSS